MRLAVRGAHQRKTLEWSYRYVARPALVGEILSLTQQSNVHYALSVSEIPNGGPRSTAVVWPHSCEMAALGRKASVQAGRMAAFTQTGRSEALRGHDLNGS
jgi:hypothetical protein